MRSTTWARRPIASRRPSSVTAVPVARVRWSTYAGSWPKCRSRRCGTRCTSVARKCSACCAKVRRWPTFRTSTSWRRRCSTSSFGGPRRSPRDARAAARSPQLERRLAPRNATQLLHARLEPLGAPAIDELGVGKARGAHETASVVRGAVVFGGHAHEVGVELAVVVLVVECRKPVRAFRDTSKNADGSGRVGAHGRRSHRFAQPAVACKQATAHDATALAEFGAELHFVRCRSFLGRGDGRAGDDDEQGARTPRGGRESPAATGADG